MNKIISIVRLVLGIFTMIAAISILAAIIYFFQDYELNVTLNTIIDDYTILFMFLCLVIFSTISIFLFTLYFKNRKLEK
jgi:uncharacterized membrane protein